ncbi:MAG: hypothetical protein E6I45_03885 [Chloroflexi bacterium]|nr:MAG: hypothetical protein E6I45_03885 [Chloroflexota bacterium]
MSRRDLLGDVERMGSLEAWLSALAVLLVALVARVVAARLVVFPTPEDTAYYFGVARNLVEGRGLITDAVWSYQTPPLVVPRPAFEVWLPLPTLLAAIPMKLLGPTFAASQLMPIVAGSLVPVLTWRLGADVALERGLPPGRRRVLALGAGLTAAVYLPLVLHSTLPDSTALFTVLALGACLLMARLAWEPRGARLRDPRLLLLGVLFGLAALTRNEVAWLGVAWILVVLAAAEEGTTAGERSRLITIPGLIGLAIFAPWAARDMMVFGSPFPGQALSNALSTSGFDIFAFRDPPTLARYLAVGPMTLLQQRVEGVTHNLLTVLLLLGAPVSVIGLIALPWTGRAMALRPLVVFSLLTFLITSLVFPVATTWGTFLHAAGPVHVLLLVSCLLALDALIVRIGRQRGWTRPVAWLGPALTVSAAVLFTAFSMPGYGAQSRGVERRFALLAEQLTAAGMPPDKMGPVVTDYPIWWAEAERTPALALPNERPGSVIGLTQTFPGTKYLVMGPDARGRWPAILDTDPLAQECFKQIALPPPSDDADREALGDTKVWRVGCE